MSKLEGELLDSWVAKAEGIPMVSQDGRMVLNTFDENHLSSPKRYSMDWAQGGPILGRLILAGFEITPIGCPFDMYRCANQTSECMPYSDVGTPGIEHEGNSALVAAMRVYVASKFGDEVPG